MIVCVWPIFESFDDYVIEWVFGKIHRCIRSESERRDQDQMCRKEGLFRLIDFLKAVLLRENDCFCPYKGGDYFHVSYSNHLSIKGYSNSISYLTPTTTEP